MSTDGRKQLKLQKKLEKARKKEEKYYLASQWTLMRRKLGKHKLAKISLFILGFLYLVALLGDFVAPYNLTAYNSSTVSVPPTTIHFTDENGLCSPYVYKTTWEKYKTLKEKQEAQKLAKEQGVEFKSQRLVVLRPIVLYVNG